VFRADCKVELWDPWTGAVRPLAVVSQTPAGTKLKLPLTETEIQLIVFGPGQPALATNSAARPTEIIKLDGDWDFELQPTSDSRFGDFHWPPTRACIGAEVRQLWYCEGDQTNGPWRRVTCSFGPQFIRFDSMPTDPGMAGPGGKPYEFSWRWGIKGDPGHQGYHGLKELVHDDFIALGRAETTATGTTYQADGSGSYLWTTVAAPRAMTAHALTGDSKPSKIWVNGEAVEGTTLTLKPGANPLLLQYTNAGRTFFIVSTNRGPEQVQAGISNPSSAPKGSVTQQRGFKVSSLTMSWNTNPAVLPFDVRPNEKSPVGWYRFESPPGLRAFKVVARGRVQAWADDQPLNGKSKFTIPHPSAASVTVSLRIEQDRGCYAGAALLEPILLDCGPGRMALGDWSKNEGLLSYSGGAWYRKKVTIPAASKVLLNLEEVFASAEIRINGKLVGVKVSPPWKLDITRFVKVGENRLEVLVCNTLTNHYTTIPTRYRGRTTSGLLGPVQMECSP
jgi:hypothetical protein